MFTAQLCVPVAFSAQILAPTYSPGLPTQLVCTKISCAGGLFWEAVSIAYELRIGHVTRRRNRL
jgi:hypothetical protein